MPADVDHGDDGWYELAGLEAGEVLVLADGSPAGYGTAWYPGGGATVDQADPVILTPGGEALVELQIVPATGELSGTVSDRTTFDPIGSVHVQAVRVSPAPMYSAIVSTNTSGAFTLDGLAPGDWTVRYRPSTTPTAATYETTWYGDAFALEAATMIPLAAGDRRDASIALSSTRPVVGGTVLHVVDGAVDGAWVRAYRTDGTFADATTTAADGSWSLTLTPGPHLFRIDGSGLGYNAEWHPSRGTATGAIALELHNGDVHSFSTVLETETGSSATGFGVITGTVVGSEVPGATPAPLGGIEVQAMRLDDLTIASSTTTTAPDGSFSLTTAVGTLALRLEDTASPTAYRSQFHGGAYAIDQAAAVVVTDGSTETVEVEMQPRKARVTADLTGFGAYDAASGSFADEGPLAHGYLNLWFLDRPGYLPTQADETGHVEVDVEPAPYGVAHGSAGYVRDFVTGGGTALPLGGGVDLTPGDVLQLGSFRATRNESILDLEVRGSTEPTLDTSPDHVTLPGVDVAVLSTTTLEPIATFTTGPDGRARGPVPTGHHLVVVSDPTGDHLPTSVDGVHGLHLALPTTFDPEALVSRTVDLAPAYGQLFGTVEGLPPFEPDSSSTPEVLAGIQVELVDPVSLSVEATTTTDSLGRFLLLPAPGDHLLRFSDPSADPQYLTRFHDRAPVVPHAQRFSFRSGDFASTRATLVRVDSVFGGTVTGPGSGSDGPLPGILVEAVDPTSGTAIGSASTDGDGRYFLVVDHGSYQLRFSDPTGTYGLRYRTATDGSVATEVLDPEEQFLADQHLPLATTPSVNAGSDQTVGTQATVQVAANFTDADPHDTHTATIDWGDGTGPTPATLDQTAGTVSGSTSYDTQGDRTVTVCVDDGSHEGCDALIVTVANAPPSVGPVTLTPTGPVATGDTVDVYAPADDADPLDVLTVTIDWGDGTTEAATYDAGTGTASGSYTYTAGGTFTVQVCADDGSDRTCDSSQITVEQANTAPSLGTITISPDAVVSMGTTVTASVPYEDPDAGDSHTATIDWGDGTGPTPATVDTTTGIVTGSHPYPAVGVYPVTVRITDAAAETASATFEYAVVFDPDGSFVTGGGWFESPPGAYPADGGLVGTATFGFVSKYVKNKSVPTGGTTFRFAAAGLEFESDAYEWLVVSGSRARFRGTGLVNGVPGYRFAISVVDAQLTESTDHDLIRVQIWDDVAIVYDNGLGASDDNDPPTAIGGGQIKIHETKGNSR